MEEILTPQLARGQKWLNVKKKAEFENDDLTLKWLPTQKSIVEDMKAFEEYSKTKSKEKK
jgi:hypothetical protein